MKVSSTFALPVLAAAVMAPVFADDFELADLDDGKWEFSRGSADCPREIKIDTEDPKISAEVLEAGQTGDELEDCTGTGSVDLIKGGSGGNGLQKAIAEQKDADTIYGGAQTGTLTCGKITFPAGAFWQFFSPEDEFKVNPSETLGGVSALLAAESDADIEFEEDKEYLIIGDQCMYEQESRAEGLVESAGDAVDDVEDSVCISGDASVETETGFVTMDSLSVGDRVRVSDGSFSDVFMFTHQKADVTYPFLELRTASGRAMAVTAGHYVPVIGRGMVAAKAVLIGDLLRTAEGKYTEVTAVSEVMKTGLFNPQTIFGDIVIDGLVASTYTTAVEPTLAHVVLSPLRALYGFMGIGASFLDGSPVGVNAAIGGEMTA